MLFFIKYLFNKNITSKICVIGRTIHENDKVSIESASSNARITITKSRTASESTYLQLIVMFFLLI